MKFYSNLRRFNNNFISSAKYIFYFAIIIIVSFYIQGHYLINENSMVDSFHSAFDIIIRPNGKEGTVGMLLLVNIILPIFNFISIRFINQEDDILYVIRNKSRNELWNLKVLYVAILALVVSIFLVFGGYFVGGLIFDHKYKKAYNVWTSSNSLIYKFIQSSITSKKNINILSASKLLFIIFIGIFLGLIAYGVLMCTLKTFIRKDAYVYFILIGIGFIDGIGSHIGLTLSLISRQMTIDAFSLVNFSEIIINYSYLVILIIMFYFIGKSINNKRDFLC